MKYMQRLLPTSAQGNSFHALITSDVNVARVSRKLRTLPGVFQVISLSEREIDSKVKSLLGTLDIGSDLLEETLGVNSNGLKIIFKKEIGVRVQTLVRDYLKKLVGIENVMIGTTVKRAMSLSWMDQIEKLLKSWGSISLFMGIFGMWFVAFISWTRSYKAEMGMLQRFQRRNLIALKAYSLVLAIIGTTISVIGLSYFKTFNPLFLGLVVMAIMLSVVFFSPVRKWQK